MFSWWSFVPGGNVSALVRIWFDPEQAITGFLNQQWSNYLTQFCFAEPWRGKPCHLKHRPVVAYWKKKQCIEIYRWYDLLILIYLCFLKIPVTFKCRKMDPLSLRIDILDDCIWPFLLFFAASSWFAKKGYIHIWGPQKAFAVCNFRYPGNLVRINLINDGLSL